MATHSVPARKPAAGGFSDRQRQLVERLDEEEEETAKVWVASFKKGATYFADLSPKEKETRRNTACAWYDKPERDYLREEDPFRDSDEKIRLHDELVIKPDAELLAKAFPAGRSASLESEKAQAALQKKQKSSVNDKIRKKLVKDYKGQDRDFLTDYRKKRGEAEKKKARRERGIPQVASIDELWKPFKMDEYQFPPPRKAGSSSQVTAHSIAKVLRGEPSRAVWRRYRKHRAQLLQELGVERY